MNGLDFDRFEARLKNRDALRDSDRIEHRKLDRIEPEYADEWPSQLNPAVRNALISSEIPRPYQHQANAIAKSLSGSDVVLESPTASGKTLAFTAPMLHALKENPGSHAMMIYPMKALAFDQRQQIRQVCEPLNIESWHYDGDTEEDCKAWLREKPAHILLTNPEYLNMSFLGSRESWEKHAGGAKFLRNLRYVIIDEMHEYRGFFGSNMALLLRRFFLHLNRIGAHPQIFLSTATCANPQEHARSLTERDVEVVSARNVLRPQRKFMFVDLDIRDFRYRETLQLRVEKAAMASLQEGLQVLVFCPTKRFLESAFSNCRRKATEKGMSSESVTAFHADLKAEKRQEIQESVKSGKVRVVFTTNALEIGLDVGGLDGVIMAGFPPSIMSAWQQIGRAGRGWDKDSFVLFYAMNDPIDRFFVGNLDTFLNKPFDELVVDPANEELIKKQLPSLMEESGGVVEEPDELILGAPFYIAARNSPGVPPKGYKPQPLLNLRGGIGQSFQLKRGGEEIGQISAMRRFREAYIGAIFPFFGTRYRVNSHEEHAIVLEDVEQHLRTEPKFFTVISKESVFDAFRYGDIEACYGSLSIPINFTGYNLVDERSGETIGTGDNNDALFMSKLHSFWLEVPQSQPAVAGMAAVEHMVRVGAMFVIPADRFDTSTHSTIAGNPSAYYYENYPGGIGVAKKLFSVWNTALERGVAIARNCRCASGCQNCIEPAKSWNISSAHIDKKAGLKLADALLQAARRGPDRKFQDGLMVPV